MPKSRKISEFAPRLTNLAQTSHYQLIFGGLSTLLNGYLKRRGVDERFISDTAGLLCNSASLPGTGFATADIIGNFQGVSEKMAHSRMFNQIELEFYVDNEYKSMRFLEHWMEFIAAGSTEPSLRDGYYFRMSYPDDYKSNQTKIIKFDRDYKNEIEYTFYGLFPIALNSTRVSYNNSDILKASAIFNFDRYIYGDVSSASTYRRNYVNMNSFINIPNSTATTSGTSESTSTDNNNNNNEYTNDPHYKDRYTYPSK